MPPPKSQEKKIHIPIQTVEDYLQIHRGIFSLTDEECRVLAEFIRIQAHIQQNNLLINPFSTEMRKLASKNLKRDNYHTLNNYIKSLKDKKALNEVEGGYEVHRILLPSTLQGEEIIHLSVRWRD
jgi:hypothetical protein